MEWSWNLELTFITRSLDWTSKSHKWSMINKIEKNNNDLMQKWWNRFIMINKFRQIRRNHTGKSSQRFTYRAEFSRNTRQTPSEWVSQQKWKRCHYTLTMPSIKQLQFFNRALISWNENQLLQFMKSTSFNYFNLLNNSRL